MITDEKDLQNMSLIRGYGAHFLHPHFLQSLNQSIFTNSGGHRNFFVNDNRSIIKPTLSNFQLPSAFIPPKYMGMELEQNTFSNSEPFRVDSTSPSCTSVSSPSKSNSFEGQLGDYESKIDNNTINMKSSSDRDSPSDLCPVCGIRLSIEEWSTHFLTEIDRLYKLSFGMERSSLLFSLCPSQENQIRTSHSRWETFQRIRTNRESRLRIKIRKRKYGGDIYFLENLFCSPCPICRRRISLDNVKSIEEDHNIKDETETFNTESSTEDAPDSGSDINGSKKMVGIFYKSICLRNKENNDNMSSEVETNSFMNSSKLGNTNELSSTTPEYFSSESCADRNGKHLDVSNNESDEEVIVDNVSFRICDTIEDESGSFIEDTTKIEDEQNLKLHATNSENLTSLSRYLKLKSDDMNMKLRILENSHLLHNMASSINVNENNESGLISPYMAESINKITFANIEKYKCLICKTGLKKYSNYVFDDHFNYCRAGQISSSTTPV